MSVTALTDDAVLTVLATVYRMHSPSVSELAGLQALSTGRLDEILATLEDAGFLVVDGDTVRPTSPDLAFTSIAASALDAQTAAARSLTAFLEALPALSREWETGLSGDDQPLSAEVIHGHRSQWEAWSRYAASAPPRHPINLYPDLTVLRDIIVPDLDAVRPAIQAGLVVRAVVPAAMAVDEEDRATLDAIVGAGVAVRTLPHVPSWLYVDDGVLAALPVTWGEHPPSSIMIVRHPTIVSALAALIESRWRDGRPYPNTSSGWDPVLALLAQGLSDAAVAQALGLSVRTVQRRIGEAMDHYAVTSRFELGGAVERAKLS
ncbi:helix-turn-helix transcriptional regulator [Compostimonas suwonensis]|uniref:Regulatory LuxR family protein n=1 Tax=Compostimonas suwonensis TaxID=1048394 RepID=A0A2M9BZX9_9MICO|nr:hypothetical protein [Compostimonas suwonensis]PJJ63628.1 regulatory LuxR family protein [Compostimonas suwonensis]